MCGKTMLRQMGCQGSCRGVRGRLHLVDADDGDGLCASQEGRCVTNRARRQAASVPRYANALGLNGPFMCVGDEQNRTASLKKDCERYRIVKCVAIALGLQHDR